MEWSKVFQGQQGERSFSGNLMTVSEGGTVGEIYLFVETDQLTRNCGSVVVAAVAAACSGS